MCTTIQTYRILTLQSMIYAYTMSTLHLENLKSSDVQNTCIGIFGAYFFFQLSNSKPVKKLSTIKPETSIFNLPFWLSVLGQAAILLTYMKLCMHYARAYSLEEDLKVTNEEEYKPNFRGSMMFLYELTSMFCISIFNHEVRCCSPRANPSCRVSATRASTPSGSSCRWPSRSWSPSTSPKASTSCCRSTWTPKMMSKT